MAKHLQKFLQFKFEVCLSCASQIAASPATSTAMCNWPTNMALGCIEKCVDMWIDLRDYGKGNTEMQVQGFQRNIGAKALRRTISIPSLSRHRTDNQTFRRAMTVQSCTATGFRQRPCSL